MLNLLQFFLHIWGGEGRALPSAIFSSGQTRHARKGWRAGQALGDDEQRYYDIYRDMREKANVSGMRARGHIMEDGGPRVMERRYDIARSGRYLHSK